MEKAVIPGNLSRTTNRIRRGFTILEVMLAAFVLIFGITSILLTLQASFRMLDRARHTTLAGQILQSQMEKLRLLSWTQLTDPVSGPMAYPEFTPDISRSASTAQIRHFLPAGGGSCTQTITDVTSPAACAGVMKDIKLTATWIGADHRRETLSYITRYGQNGISDFFYTAH
jgi:type II secretory pathway pseudopilin PulG